MLFRSIDIGKLLASSGHMTLDDGYANTGATQSNITFLDGDQGIDGTQRETVDQLLEEFCHVSSLSKLNMAKPCRSPPSTINSQLSTILTAPPFPSIHTCRR